MTTPADRPNSALLVIDVQNDVVALAHDRAGVVDNINQVVAKARAAEVPVIWVQHNDDGLPADTDGWQIVPELDPQPSETVVHKNFRDSFDATTLETELAEHGIGRLIITGAQTDFCVRWTLHGALARGYDTVLVADGHTTDAASPAGLPTGQELIAHTNNIWASQATSCETGVAPAAAIEF